jgi:Holliday junction DNA helicase RuvA
MSRIDDGMNENEQVREDALSALINLGYKSNKVGSVLDKIINECSESVTLDVLLKESLKILAG